MWSFGDALDVEAEGIGEVGLVAVGGRVEQEELVALRELRAVEVDVARNGARHVLHRTDPAQHLFDRRREQRPILPEPLPLLGVRQELVGAAAHDVTGGLVAADQDQERLEHELLVVQSFAVDLGVDERADDVLARRRPSIGDDVA